MKPYFFDNIDTLHQFTLSLDQYNTHVCCQRCAKTDQFVSHGFIYQKQHQAVKLAIGKRLFCSNRYGHTGCGGTLQLYLSERIPMFVYSALHVMPFIVGLLSGMSVQQAYDNATGRVQPRQGFRWLAKLNRALGHFKRRLTRSNSDTIAQVKTRYPILCATIRQLQQQYGSNFISAFQSQHQCAFC